jgi:hypothetical protein
MQQGAPGDQDVQEGSWLILNEEGVSLQHDYWLQGLHKCPEPAPAAALEKSAFLDGQCRKLTGNSGKIGPKKVLGCAR